MKTISHRLSHRHSSNTSLTVRPLVSPENDRELEWLFTQAETEMSVQSNWNAFADAALSGDRDVEGESLEEVEARTFAVHRARTILGWLEAMPPALAAVLVAAHEPRAWPARYELRLGRLAGVVAGLPSVRAGFEAARAEGRTAARDPVEWFEDEIERGEDLRAEAALEEARGRYAAAVAGYREARGTRPCLLDET